MTLVAASVVSGSGAVSVDPDAKAFVDKYSISDPTEKAAINELTANLKSGPLFGTDTFNPAKGIYTISPTSAAASVGNLVNLDLPLIPQVAAGHGPTGLAFTGTQWYLTGITPSTDLDINSITCGTYAQDNVSGPGTYFGSNNGNSQRLDFRARTGGNLYMAAWTSSFLTGLYQTGNPNSQGFCVVSRRSVNDMEGWARGVSFGLETDPNAGTKPVHDLAFGCLNSGGSQSGFLINTISFGYLGGGLTGNQAFDLTESINRYQLALNRFVL